MTGHQYEQFARAVLVRELKLSPDELRSTRMPGVQFPGEKELKHQIDLFYVDETEVAEYITIFQCKYRKSRKVGQAEVLLLASVRSNISASKAILVTNRGFTSGADSAAARGKIGLSVITPRIDVYGIDKALRGEDLFQSIDAKLQESPHGYDFEVKRKFAPDPGDRSMDLMSAFISRPTVRRQVVSSARAPEVPKVVKQITRHSPNIVRKGMDSFKK